MNRVCKLSLTACVLVIAFLLLSHKAVADGDWEVAGTVKWTVDQDGTLWLVPLEGTRGNLEVTNTGWHRAPWDGVRKKIRTLMIPEGNTIVWPADSTHLFHGCVNLENFDSFVRCDVSGVTDMNYLFSDCEKMKNVDMLSGWNISNVTNLGNLFLNCTSLSDLNGISNWVLSNVKVTCYMFCNCVSLVDLKPIERWDVQRAEDWCYMFSGCEAIFDFTPLANWQTNNLIIASGMFQMCPLFVSNT